MKKIFAILLSLSLLLGAVPAAAFADAPDGLTASQYRAMARAARDMEDYIRYGSSNIILGTVASMEITHPDYAYYDCSFSGYEYSYFLGYCLAPLDVFEAEFRVANPTLPKNLFTDYIFRPEAFMEVDCYDRMHNPATITLGYVEEAGTYGAAYIGGIGGDKEYELDGYIDNGDGTYNFYTAKGYYDWESGVFTKTGGGVVFKFRPDDDGVYMVSYDAIESLPESYSDIPQSAPLTHDQYNNALAASSFVLNYDTLGYICPLWSTGQRILDINSSFGFYQDPEEHDSVFYIVAPVELFGQNYYAANPYAPKGFYETRVIRNLFCDNAARTVTAYNADNETVDIVLGYDSAALTYGIELIAVGGGAGSVYQGFKANGDGTYGFYYASYDYDAQTPLSYGTCLTLCVDGDDIEYYYSDYIEHMPDEYDAVPKERIPKGDVDKDGSVTVADALSVLRVAAKLAQSTPDMIRFGDVDCDGSITVADALSVLRVAAKLVSAESLGYVEDVDERALNIGYSGFNGKFSPFFCESDADSDVVSMTQLNLLTSDRTGAVIEKGIDGTTVNYNGTDYIYYGPADLEIIEKADGYVDYMITLRKDLRFSDGTYVTIDDVIFTMYVLADPAYSGTLTFFSLPIDGMNEYRSGWGTLNNLIFYAGRSNTDFTYWTNAQQTEFWNKYDATTIALAQEIVDYCVTNGYNEEGDIRGAADAWGFLLPRDATIYDFADALSYSYGADVAGMVSTETAGSTIDDLFPGYDAFSQTAIKIGASAERIRGIKRTGDYSMTITMTQVDATALYSLCIPIAPMHYYGNSSDYYYARNRFGFNKGELSSIGAKTSAPMGAGPYKFVAYENDVISFEANEYYYRGEPKTNLVNFVEMYTDVAGLVTGDYDIASPTFSDDAVDCIKKANSNGELCGDKIETATVDNLGYGYIGMCANIMNVGGDPASDASKALRKGFATIFALFRDDSIDAYYGDRASVINYPISNSSWAAPQPADDGYRIAFSVDKEGNKIYTEGMSAEEKREAAKAAALGFFEAAGYTVSGGKVIAAPAGASLEYTAWIPADGCGDHPSFMILVEAKKALADIGITLIINDLTNSSDLWTGLEYQEVAIWCAAWQSSVDPDMYQIYFSGDDTHDAGGSNYQYCIDDADLNKLILDARASTDQAYRKAIYKSALDIVIDWAVEIPVYQRQNAIIFSSERVDLDTVAHDITPFYGWLNEVADIVMK